MTAPTPDLNRPRSSLSFSPTAMEGIFAYQIESSEKLILVRFGESCTEEDLHRFVGHIVNDRCFSPDYQILVDFGDCHIDMTYKRMQVAARQFAKSIRAKAIAAVTACPIQTTFCIMVRKWISKGLLFEIFDSGPSALTFLEMLRDNESRSQNRWDPRQALGN